MRLPLMATLVDGGTYQSEQLSTVCLAGGKNFHKQGVPFCLPKPSPYPILAS